jgi:polysaccharide export outer membrane protein
LKPEAAPQDYQLGADDQIALLVPDADELNGKAFRIGATGDLDLPLVGRVHAAGLTAQQLEADLGMRLEKFLQKPEVVLAITEFRSQPISVLGAVNAPGVHQLQGRKNLYEVLSLAGGLREDAGDTVKITRKLRWGKIPLPTAKDDPSGQFSVASVSVKGILEASKPEDNIAVKPEDVISIPKANVVYVVGSVHRPGGFTMGENASLSALQVLSLAEGLDNTAAPAKARILRATTAEGALSETPIDLKKLLAGKCPDVRLGANDILFIPDSFAKSAAVRALETAIGMGGQIGAGLAIYK